MNRDCVIEIDPSTIPTAQQKGERVVMSATGKPFVHHYEKSKVAKGRRSLEFAIRRSVGSGLIMASKDKPVLVSVEFVYPLSKSNKRAGGAYKTTRPDIDNLLKGFFDACTNIGLWEDDSQVQINSAIKRYAIEGESPCIKFSFDVGFPMQKMQVKPNA